MSKTAEVTILYISCPTEKGRRAKPQEEERHPFPVPAEKFWKDKSTFIFSQGGGKRNRKRRRDRMNPTSFLFAIA